MAKKPEKEPKGLKLNIKNEQIAKAINLKGLKDKLAKKKASDTKEDLTPSKLPTEGEEQEAEAPKIKARSKSAFAKTEDEVLDSSHVSEREKQTPEPSSDSTQQKVDKSSAEEIPEVSIEESGVQKEKASEEKETPKSKETKRPEVRTLEKKGDTPKPRTERLGPTGRHVKDLLPAKKVKEATSPQPETSSVKERKDFKQTAPTEPGKKTDKEVKKAGKGSKFREFRDMKSRAFDPQSQIAGEEGHFRFRKKRQKGPKQINEELTIRPSELFVRLPIPIKDLALQMKRKASELVGQLFKHGIMATLNDVLDDETIVQILGSDLDCEIKIDTTAEERMRVTDKTIQEEISESASENLTTRAPIVTFMGHVDHGKTSLIDQIRSSNVASGEAGAITQHIGAFRCHTPVGDIAILDTPGHEAFGAMRSRGANVTDIVVLVVAGDEGFKQQTDEALAQAKEAEVSLIVAINKCDKQNFNVEKIYRELSDRELLPEAWGGQTITVNTSAVTKEGIETLLEMLALQSEVMELKANPKFRGRGTVIESEMHKGLGSVSTVLVQNGTLKKGDAVVAGPYWGRIKIMHDEHGKAVDIAGPSTPVELIGLSGIPDAGEEFIVIETEKGAREIAEARTAEIRHKQMQRKAPVLDTMLATAQATAEKKVFNVVICADVQGSLEALETALKKIHSDKVDLYIVGKDVGEVSESDIELASASNAVIIGFHTQIESHAEPIAKQLGVTLKLHDIIYHATDDVKELMRQTLDKVAVENDRGIAEVRQIFKSSHLGTIAGCYVTEGTINRNYHVRVHRDGEEVWRGPISSVKRLKEDVKEVQKGYECGILLHGYNDVQEGDLLETFEITYHEQEL